MSDLELLASGRDADIYALDDATVLRRVRDPAHSRTLHEAKVMTYLAERGYPVPRVYEADETSMVMERLAGPTLLEDLGRRPWALWANARMLAALHDELAAIPAPDWLGEPAPGEPGRTPGERTGAGTEADADEAGHALGHAHGLEAGERPGPRRASVLHLDLHPGNVIRTAAGPVVIDWTNCAAGDPAFDLAKTLVTLETADLATWPRRRVRDLYVRALRRAARIDPAPRLADALREKLRDPNLSPAEAARLRALLARETGETGGETAPDHTAPAHPPV